MFAFKCRFILLSFNGTKDQNTADSSNAKNTIVYTRISTNTGRTRTSRTTHCEAMSTADIRMHHTPETFSTLTVRQQSCQGSKSKMREMNPFVSVPPSSSLSPSPPLPFPPLPFPIASLPHPFPFPPLPLLPLEVGPLNAARGSAVSSPSGVWGGAPAEIEFGALIALKSDIWWHQFY